MDWTGCGRRSGDGFLEKVTAFHDQMAVHGKFGRPCPVCGAPVQRIVYSSNETNYCLGSPNRRQDPRRLLPEPIVKGKTSLRKLEDLE